MLLQIGTWVEIHETINTILQTELNGQFGLALAILGGHIEADLSAFYQKRKQLYERYGKELEGIYTVPPEMVKELTAELLPLLEMHIDIHITLIDQHYLDFERIQGVLVKRLLPIVKVEDLNGEGKT